VIVMNDDDMTDTHQTQSAPPRRSLHRSRHDNILAGVSAGLGEHFAINAWWFRWAFVILAFFGGLGVLLYVLAWIFIPADDEENTAAVRWLESVDLTDTGTILGVVLIGAAAIVIATQVINIPGSLVFAGILFAIGILLYRGDIVSRSPSAPIGTDDGKPKTDDEPDDGYPTTDDRDDDVTSTEDVGGALVASALVADTRSQGGDVNPPKVKKVKATKPPKPRRESSMLGRLTIAAALIVLSGMALLESSGITIGSHQSGDLFDPIHYGATGLAIIGIGLLVGAFVGRARWLIIVGILVLPLVFLSAVWPRAFEWTAADQSFSPVTAAQVDSEYSQGAGQFWLDLSQLSPEELAEVGQVTITLGAGEATILVPADTGINVNAKAGLGEVRVSRAVGSSFDIDTSSGINARLIRGVGPEPYVLTLDVEIGAGQIFIQAVERDTP
jgi:phage shock protein PspC (stress-responsive transcriptional regulator)